MQTTREFQPEKNSRRGAVLLWALAVMALTTWGFLGLERGSIPLFRALFAVFLLFAAAITSLSNWVDRKTVLTLEPEGIGFTNGLRNLSLGWDQLQEVRIIPTRFGRLVQILGAETSFQFRTLSVIEQKGEIRARMGFAAGDFILEQILKSSGLQEIDQTGQGRYYARPQGRIARP